jgi:hypothetical protein
MLRIEKTKPSVHATSGRAGNWGLSGIFDQSQRFKPTKPGDAGKMAGRYWVARALL